MLAGSVLPLGSLSTRYLALEKWVPSQVDASKVNWLKSSLKLVMRNLHPSPCTVEFWFITARSDQVGAASTSNFSVNGGTNNFAVGTDDPVWSMLVNATTDLGEPAADDCFLPEWDPFQAATFTTTWKVLGRKRFRLKPYGEKRFNFKKKPFDQNIDNMYQTTVNSANRTLRAIKDEIQIVTRIWGDLGANGTGTGTGQPGIGLCCAGAAFRWVETDCFTVASTIATKSATVENLFPTHVGSGVQAAHTLNSSAPVSNIQLVQAQVPAGSTDLWNHGMPFLGN